jgi:hypothetical protein
MPRRHRKMKGGFLESLGSTLSGWGSSISQSASNAYNKTKNATSSAYSSATTPTTSTSYTPTPTSTSTPTTSTSHTPTTRPTTSTSTTSSGAYGGKKRKSRKMRGGYSNNVALNSLAANASPISGIKSAEPHNWVGGKTSRKNRRGTRSKK